MNVPPRHQARADEYRARAADAEGLAAASVLDNVREKHERAAEVWTALALLQERGISPPAAI